jgi:hypothetical protein
MPMVTVPNVPPQAAQIVLAQAAQSVQASSIAWPRAIGTCDVIGGAARWAPLGSLETISRIL